MPLLWPIITSFCGFKVLLKVLDMHLNARFLKNNKNVGIFFWNVKKRKNVAKIIKKRKNVI